MKNPKLWPLSVVLLCGAGQAAETAAPVSAAIVPTKATSIGKIEKTLYDGHEAWKLSNGQCEAVIVPELARVMSFNRIGGPNCLWNAPADKIQMGNWKNYGGDKTWPAPQNVWAGVTGTGWPPPVEWDGMAHKAGIKAGKLWMVSPVARGFGARVVRQFWFDANGDFVIEQAAEKIKGEPIYFSLWSVTQVGTTDAIYLPLNPQSPYKNNFHWIAKPKAKADVTPVSPTLLRVIPSIGNDDDNFKIGTDAPVSAAVAVKDGQAFVVRTAKPGGDYPDGALNAGFPVELWNMGPRDVHYNELELLSPIRLYKKGTRWRHTMRWSIHQLPTKDTNSPTMTAAIEDILNEK